MLRIKYAEMWKERPVIMKTINEYMNMSYRMELTQDKDEGGFVVSFSECLDV